MARKKSVSTPSPAADAPTLYTIGHSTRDWEAFVDLLKTWHITHLVDVRRAIVKSCGWPRQVKRLVF